MLFTQWKKGNKSRFYMQKIRGLNRKSAYQIYTNDVFINVHKCITHLLTHSFHSQGLYLHKMFVVCGKQAEHIHVSLPTYLNENFRHMCVCERHDNDFCVNNNDWIGNKAMKHFKHLHPDRSEGGRGKSKEIFALFRKRNNRRKSFSIEIVFVCASHVRLWDVQSKFK